MITVLMVKDSSCWPFTWPLRGAECSLDSKVTPGLDVALTIWEDDENRFFNYCSRHWSQWWTVCSWEVSKTVSTSPVLA